MDTKPPRTWQQSREIVRAKYPRAVCRADPMVLHGVGVNYYRVMGRRDKGEPPIASGSFSRAWAWHNAADKIMEVE